MSRYFSIFCLLVLADVGCQALPVHSKENVKIFNRPTHDVNVDFDSDSLQDVKMKQKIDEVLEELGNLKVKAVYSHQVELEKLVNEDSLLSDSPADEKLPKYVITREEKVYFFSESSDDLPGKGEEDAVQQREENGEANSQQTPDEETDEILQKLFAVAKKHTNNPPDFRGLSDDFGGRFDVKRLFKSQKFGDPKVSDISRKENLMEALERVNSKDLDELIRSLRSYVDTK